MTPELLVTLLALTNAVGAGVLIMAVREAASLRRELVKAADAHAADREVLRAAAEANNTLAAELGRQGDRLASLEMRMGTQASPTIQKRF